MKRAAMVGCVIALAVGWSSLALAHDSREGCGAGWGYSPGYMMQGPGMMYRGGWGYGPPMMQGPGMMYRGGWGPGQPMMQGPGMMYGGTPWGMAPQGPYWAPGPYWQGYGYGQLPAPQVNEEARKQMLQEYIERVLPGYTLQKKNPD